MRQIAATNDIAVPTSAQVLKPLMRGWLHAGAAACAVALTIVLAVRTWGDWPRMASLLVFGLTMIELYTVSAVYHIGRWSATVRGRLRALDHANIFLLIAGTYTPLCFIVLSGWLRPTLLIVVWTLAIVGVGMAALTLKTPRWVSTGLYVAMGWVSLLALPAFGEAMGWAAVLTLILGGVLYTLGAVVYAAKKPNPFPRIFGFHEVFHTFVIAGSAAFALAIWVWAVPFPHL
jgi:hemolysin III